MLNTSELAATVNHAGCDPYDQVVTIPNDRTNVLLYPSCVVLKQCEVDPARSGGPVAPVTVAAPSVVKTTTADYCAHKK
ncbi:hypothetical protein EB796_025206 [Bugula neritina]|uniref:Uncharacterized protein n=1 Tax=Bugula neritina TaxID=10212 RepID=A0A7J7ITE6_BUGNE|nr:hypothetical protein EB796_025206 [Bugula neritina]